MSTLEYHLFYRRRLPHYQPDGATLFITFRLAGSIPQEASAKLLEECRRTDVALDRIEDVHERTLQADLAHRRMFAKWDALIDTAGSGPHWLRDRQVAALVAEALRYRDGHFYALHAYCIMPNHVHMVCTPLAKMSGGYQSMSSFLHSLKGYTARMANQYLDRTGDFWQHESYDHVVRDNAEMQRIITYVVNNPVKANLVSAWEDWEWTYYKP
ncbi:MAG: transposase [Chloroflexi bacterium]|nr:transposase [Chloroflexota bacterium]